MIGRISKWTIRLLFRQCERKRTVFLTNAQRGAAEGILEARPIFFATL
jgi:hypothetical protein